MATTIFDASNRSPSLTKLEAGQRTPAQTFLTPQQSTSSNLPNPHASGKVEEKQYRRLEKGDWLQFCRGVGILKDEESEELVRVTSYLCPTTGFKPGLFCDVLCQKTKFTYYYHAVSIIAWVLMLLQIALSAVLTALGALSRRDGSVITIIAAINTSLAGILALLHNSGLPERYRRNRNEFYKVEEHIKEIADTGLVPFDVTVNDALAECFEMFSTALQTVENNIPASYTTPTTPKNPPKIPPKKQEA